MKQNAKNCTYVGLYGSGLFNSGLTSQPCLHTFWVLTSPTSSSIFIENVFFIILVSIFFLNGGQFVNIFCRRQRYLV